MYMDKVLEVGKAENGFVISCNVPIEPSKKDTKDMPMSMPCDSENKMYLAKDAAEVGAIILKIMPLLDMDFKTEEEFDKAFAEAAGTPLEKE